MFYQFVNSDTIRESYLVLTLILGNLLYEPVEDSGRQIAPFCYHQHAWFPLRQSRLECV